MGLPHSTRLPGRSTAMCPMWRYHAHHLFYHRPIRHWQDPRPHQEPRHPQARTSPGLSPREASPQTARHGARLGSGGCSVGSHAESACSSRTSPLHPSALAPPNAQHHLHRASNLLTSLSRHAPVACPRPLAPPSSPHLPLSQERKRLSFEAALAAGGVEVLAAGVGVQLGSGAEQDDA